jgi:hypothetical protein
MYPESVGLGEEPCIEDVAEEGLDTDLLEPGLDHVEDDLTRYFTINQSYDLNINL